MAGLGQKILWAPKCFIQWIIQSAYDPKPSVRESTVELLMKMNLNNDFYSILLDRLYDSSVSVSKRAIQWASVCINQNLHRQELLNKLGHSLSSDDSVKRHGSHSSLRMEWIIILGVFLKQI
ncbi:hypothetical protein ROZALSC1DRAFT_23294 [Rozella allomycis CSF55]|uniref:Condensin complex subunit 1 C-terminal domain-containing protein n=1 Tax=Rozella allomycis (strain CSF55) TaxID=988480 RepID=A0A4P9YJ45_ROZAC|nr:hypothetical protein ROZALSC1DRAFT_23294 [Rozella allomycis CSF55]